MAYVTIPKDLSKVKNKVAFNLTKRQLICIGIGAAVGIPFYFLTRGVLGNSNAATVMVPQEFGLYPNLTVRESLEYVGIMSGVQFMKSLQSKMFILWTERSATLPERW